MAYCDEMIIIGDDRRRSSDVDQLRFCRDASGAKRPEHGLFQPKYFPNNPVVMAIHHRVSDFCFLRLFWVLVLPFAPMKIRQMNGQPILPLPV
jgi:hypothetical protein